MGLMLGSACLDLVIALVHPSVKCALLADLELDVLAIFLDKVSVDIVIIQKDQYPNLWMFILSSTLGCQSSL